MCEWKKSQRGPEAPFRSQILYRFPIWHAAVFHDSELQRNHPFIPKLRGPRHYREPIALYALVHARKVIVEIDALGRRKHFNARRRGAPSSASRSSPRGDVPAATDGTRGVHLSGLAYGILNRASWRTFRQLQTVRARLFLRSLQLQRLPGRFRFWNRPLGFWRRYD